MEAFGIDLKLFIAQVINFSILVFLLAKFAYKPILAMLDERRETIATGLKDSEASQKKLAEAENEKKKILEKAFKEADEILQNAKKDSVEKATAIIAKTNAQAENIMKRANEEALLAKERALKEAKTEISQVVLLALDKIVGTELDANEKSKLTTKAIQEL